MEKLSGTMLRSEKNYCMDWASWEGNAYISSQFCHLCDCCLSNCHCSHLFLFLLV